MKLSIIHATRRAIGISVASKWLHAMSRHIPVEYILSVDKEDPNTYIAGESFGAFDFKVIRNENRSAVDAFNRGAEKATGDIFICISDDMECFPGWDLALAFAIFRKKDFYLKVQDGIQPTLVTMPIFDREYYNRLGYVWYEGFDHMFCDQEATAVAIMTGRYIKSDLLFPHAHYSVGKSPKDTVNIKNDNTWGQGEALFNERLKTNFGIKDPVINYSDIRWK